MTNLGLSTAHLRIHSPRCGMCCPVFADEQSWSAMRVPISYIDAHELTNVRACALPCTPILSVYGLDCSKLGHGLSQDAQCQVLGANLIANLIASDAWNDFGNRRWQWHRKGGVRRTPCWEQS